MKKIRRICFALFAPTIFFFASSAQAQTPKLVYSDSSTASSESGNGFKIVYGGSMGTGSLAGNLITLRMTAPHGSTISSIVDNKSDTYTLATTADSGSWVTALYYLANAPAGINSITVNYSASVAQWHYALEEYSGVATSSPADGNCSSHTATISCSLTTTAANDLIVSTMIASGGAGIYENGCSTIAPGTGAILDAADTQSCDADEEQTQSSAGSVTPGFTITGNSQTVNIAAAAFKSATAGTNPTGMYILHMQKVQVNTGGTQNTYFVSSGNLLVAAFELGPSFTTYSISSCAPSNAWTKITLGTYFPQTFYIPASGSFSTDMHCTVSGGNGNNGHVVIYDIVGAATSPEDVDSPGGMGNGGTVTDSLTPKNKPGIIISSANDGTGPVTSYTASAGTAIFDNTRYTGETDSGQLNNGDSWGHTFYTAASSTTLTWVMSNSGSYMQTQSIAFDAADGSSQGPPAAPTDLQVSVQ